MTLKSCPAQGGLGPVAFDEGNGVIRSRMSLRGRTYEQRWAICWAVHGWERWFTLFNDGALAPGQCSFGSRSEPGRFALVRGADPFASRKDRHSATPHPRHRNLPAGG